jgi:prepilin-type N-terminal cleavage/methylation domain-containing protein
MVMIKRNKQYKQGFTIIEVVLVLAIAGLIFLMVFIALPALQRNQRDAQRKNDMAAFLDAYERCRSNNQGTCLNGGDVGTFNMLVNSGYIKVSEHKDPSSGEFYRVRGAICPTYCGDGGWQNIEIGQVIVNVGGGCSAGGMHDYPAGHPKAKSTFVFLTRLEGGGHVCASNENL